MLSRNSCVVLVALLLLFLGLNVLEVRGYSSIWSSSGTLILPLYSSTSSNSSQAKVFTLITGRTGLNGSSAEFILQVNQGDTVSINFVYGDGDLLQDNPHVMEIEGYNIVTNDIGKTYPNQTIQLVAGQVGKFLIHCVIPCLGMEDLQNGWLRVTFSGQAGIPTVLSLENIQVQNGLLYIVSSLNNESGNPVVGVIADFAVSTKFGMMKVGSNVTDANGAAQLIYLIPSYREMTIGAYFSGSGNYGPSNTTEAFTPPLPTAETNETTPYARGQNKLIDLRLVGVPTQQAAIMVAMVLIVIGAVWLTYANVLRLIFKIRKASRLKGMTKG